jgi:hypothetical protein
MQKKQGLVFMDQAGNIVDDSNDNTEVNLEITGMEITGVTTQPQSTPTETENVPTENKSENIPIKTAENNLENINEIA